MLRGNGAHSLCAAKKQVYHNEQNNRVCPVADEGCSKSTKYHVDSYPNGKEEACGDDVHPCQRIHRRGTTNYATSVRYEYFGIGKGNRLRKSEPQTTKMQRKA